MRLTSANRAAAAAARQRASTSLSPHSTRIRTRTCAGIAAHPSSWGRPISIAAISPHSSCHYGSAYTQRRPNLRPFASSALCRSSAHATATPPAAEVHVHPTARYGALVESGVLNDDAHQRPIIAILQGLHDELREYEHSRPEEPLGFKKKEESGGFFARLFGGGRSKTEKEEEEENKLKRPDDAPRGLYLFGDVGTGKSMLMDLFYDTLPPNITRKRRVHFHQFMIDAHKRTHAFKALTHRPSGIVVGASSAIMGGSSLPSSSSSSGSPGESARSALSRAGHQEEVDPIPHVAMEFAQEATVLCFDEFQVTDIADAMILRRLLEHMIAHGVILVMTSNRHPTDLYKNGIQRSSFLPCIELLKTQLKVQDLNSGTDYRKVPRALSKVYFAPMSDENNQREFEKLFEAFTSDPCDPPTENRTLTVWGRPLAVPTSTRTVARFTFQELCGSPRSAADYIEICRNFPTVFVESIPRMGLDQREVARRFITFIDAAYESKTKLFASSEVPILQTFGAGDDGHKGAETSDVMRETMDALGMTMDQLGGNPIFSGDEELFAFARVISRLTEMGTTHYAQLAGISDAGAASPSKPTPTPTPSGTRAFSTSTRPATMNATVTTGRRLFSTTPRAMKAFSSKPWQDPEASGSSNSLMRFIPSIRRRPFLLFGLPFTLTILLAAYGLSYLTQTRYDYNASKKRTLSVEEELGMKKNRRRVDLREEYFRLSGGTAGSGSGGGGGEGGSADAGWGADWEPKRIERPEGAPEWGYVPASAAAGEYATYVESASPGAGKGKSSSGRTSSALHAEGEEAATAGVGAGNRIVVTPSGQRLVIGPDGKPCRACSSRLAFAEAMRGQKAGGGGSGAGAGAGAGVAAGAGLALSAATASAGTSPSPSDSLPEDCPPDVESLGRASWSLIHSVAAAYPSSDPSPAHQSALSSFLSSLPTLYPCSYCADELRREYARREAVASYRSSAGLPPGKKAENMTVEQAVQSREKAMRFTCSIHNEVNGRLGKPKWDCEDLKMFRERWEDGGERCW